MKRRLLNLLAAPALLPCVAAAVPWLRGYYVIDSVQWSAPCVGPQGGRVDVLSLISGNGVVAVLWEREQWGGALRRTPRAASRAPGVSHSTLRPAHFVVVCDTAWQRAGFNHFDSTVGSPPVWHRRTRGLRVPYWILLLCPAALPAASWLSRHSHARRRARQGQCRRCGYDLRATPDRCPECGEPVAGRPPAAS